MFCFQPRFKLPDTCNIVECRLLSKPFLTVITMIFCEYFTTINGESSCIQDIIQTQDHAREQTDRSNGTVAGQKIVFSSLLINLNAFIIIARIYYKICTDLRTIYTGTYFLAYHPTPTHHQYSMVLFFKHYRKLFSITL